MLTIEETRLGSVYRNDKEYRTSTFRESLSYLDEFDLYAKLGYLFDKMFQKHKKRRLNLSKF